MSFRARLKVISHQISFDRKLPRNTMQATDSLVVEQIVAVSNSTAGTVAKARAGVWSLSYIALVASLCLAFALVIMYAAWVKQLILLPADILMWAETNFIGDIIKLRTGAPLYTAPADSNSLIYTPLAPLVTYAIAGLAGVSDSIVALRLIQILFVTLAALLAVACSERLRRLAFPEYRVEYPKTWLLFSFTALFLIATAPETNRFAHALHADALALLVSLISFWAMLRYAERATWRNLLLMAACPAIGFLTKQFLISWLGVMLVFLVLTDWRRWRRWLGFAVIALGGVALAVGVCRWMWGDAFMFWAFEVMGGARRQIVFSPHSNSISLARGFDHLLRAWLEIALGIIGGALLFRVDNVRRLSHIWAGWLVLVASEALSSGAGWRTLYHFGPGVLIGAAFLFAALPIVWLKLTRDDVEIAGSKLMRWTRCAATVACVLAIFIAVQVVPSADRSSPRAIQSFAFAPDINRYLGEIESELSGVPLESVLLDVGNWVYLPEGVLQRDRAVSLADQPMGGMYENFGSLLERIRQRRYAKIIVHDFHSPFFLYDWADWERPSGVRQALLENYTEARKIVAPEMDASLQPHIALTGAVSVFVPRAGNAPQLP